MTNKTQDEILIKALEILARDIQSDDGVANACIFEAAERLRKLSKQNKELYENQQSICKTNKILCNRLKELTEWQPIETAPKDGTPVLLYYPNINLVIRGIYDWIDGNDNEYGIDSYMDWIIDSCSDYINDNPTHWQPLPLPPKEI